MNTNDAVAVLRDQINALLPETETLTSWTPREKDAYASGFRACQTAASFAASEFLAATDSAATVAKDTAGEVHADDKAVDAFAVAMKVKMATQRAKGYGGWDQIAACTDRSLADKLMEHTKKGDPLDVANFCMMLHQRNQDQYDFAVGTLRIAALDFAKRVASMWLPEVATPNPEASAATQQAGNIDSDTHLRKLFGSIHPLSIESIIAYIKENYLAAPISEDTRFSEAECKEYENGALHRYQFDSDEDYVRALAAPVSDGDAMPPGKFDYELMMQKFPLPETRYNGCGDGSEPLYTPEMVCMYAHQHIVAMAHARAPELNKALDHIAKLEQAARTVTGSGGRG